MRLNPLDVKLGDGRWLRFKKAIFKGFKMVNWRCAEGLGVVAGVKCDLEGMWFLISVSHVSRNVSDEDCKLVADILFPANSAIKWHEEKNFPISQSKRGKAMLLDVPVPVKDIDAISPIMQQALGQEITRLIRVSAPPVS